MADIDFEKWDQIYMADIDCGMSIMLQNKATELFFGKESEMSVSEAFKLMLKSDKKKPFDVMWGSRSIEAYTLARMLNDELKIVTSIRPVHIFGNLDHYIARKPIVYDSSYERADEFGDEAVSVANQVYFLEEIKPGYEELIERFRKDLYNMLKYGDTRDFDNLFDE